MEEKKTKKIDLVVVMAILILIAFIGVMSFAMVQGIMQYTKKDAVAYADDNVSSNNLFKITQFRNAELTTFNETMYVNTFYSHSFSFERNNPYTLFGYWGLSSIAVNTGQNGTSNSGAQLSFPTSDFYGLYFPLLESIHGIYYFSYRFQTLNSNIKYIQFTFNSWDGTSLTTLDTSSILSLSTQTDYTISFNIDGSIDTLYIGMKVYNSSQSQITNYNAYLTSVYLSSTNNVNLTTTGFVDGFTSGYYTGYAAASSDDGDQLDLVGNNLFEYQFNQPWDDTYAKLVRNGDTYKGWQIHSSGSAMYNYDEVNSYSIFKYYGSSVSYNYDFYFYLDDYDSGDYTFSFNYDYGDIDAHDFKLLALTFTIPETDPVSEETLAYIQDDNADVTLTATYYQGRYLISIACMLSSTADLICRYAKLETGSNFTGFVPLDYYNYGYNQGYQNGQGDLLGSRNYVLLDYLSFSGNTRNLTSDFVFNNTNYVYGDYTEDLLSLYNYNNPNFAVIDSLDGAPSGSQVGYKYENENLYGDILLMMPYCDDNLRVVFEVVDSGEVLITSQRDTVHWSLNSHLGNVNGQASWSCDLYTIHFYSPSQVNIYFLPYQPLDYGNEAMYLPLNTKSWRVYSTQTNTALSSFDDGYLSGLEQGKEQQAEQDATLIARARGQGYEEGRRDALEDTSDYTFMGLIGSVIDAPITSFRGLLNFSILGVNMQSFVLAILTLCVIIVVIKIALGGK